MLKVALLQKVHHLPTYLHRTCLFLMHQKERLRQTSASPKSTATINTLVSQKERRSLANNPKQAPGTPVTMRRLMIMPRESTRRSGAISSRTATLDSLLRRKEFLGSHAWTRPSHLSRFGIPVTGCWPTAPDSQALQTCVMGCPDCLRSRAQSSTLFEK